MRSIVLPSMHEYTVLIGPQKQVLVHSLPLLDAICHLCSLQIVVSRPACGPRSWTNALLCFHKVWEYVHNAYGDIVQPL